MKRKKEDPGRMRKEEKKRKKEGREGNQNKTGNILGIARLESYHYRSFRGNDGTERGMIVRMGVIIDYGRG